MNSLDEKNIRDGLTFLVSYLVTSARELIDEPKSYGPLRLMETANRIIALMNQNGISNDILDRIAKDIGDGKLSQRMDQSESEVEQTIALLDAVVLKAVDAVSSLVP